MDGPGSLHAQDVRGVESDQQLGVIIVAENARLSQGGESNLAVQWFRELLKKRVDVHLLVHARSKRELDQSLADVASRIHYVPDVFVQKFFWTIGKALPPHVKEFTTGW